MTCFEAFVPRMGEEMGINVPDNESTQHGADLFGQLVQTEVAESFSAPFHMKELQSEGMRVPYLMPCLLHSCSPPAWTAYFFAEPLLTLLLGTHTSKPPPPGSPRRHPPEASSRKGFLVRETRRE